MHWRAAGMGVQAMASECSCVGQESGRPREAGGDGRGWAGLGRAGEKYSE